MAQKWQLFLSQHFAVRPNIYREGEESTSFQYVLAVNIAPYTSAVPRIKR
jgi:hypothetical protein